MFEGSTLIAIIRASHFPQTVAMVGLATVSSAIVGVTGWGLLFVAAAVLAGQLSVGWSNDYIDAHLDVQLGRRNKPVVEPGLDPQKLKVPIAVALVLVGPLSFMAAGFIGGLAHLAAVAAAWMYNLYLARTVWSWLPYAVAFALFPVFVAQAASPDLWPSISVVMFSTVVGTIVHILNAVPDIAIDKQAGIGGLAVSLGRWKSTFMAIALIVVAIVVAASIALNEIF